MTQRLHGLVAATYTPFDKDGELDLSKVEDQASHLIQSGVTAAFIGGTTGECHSLTLNERLELTERWMAVVKGATLRVVVHVGSNCLADSRALAAQAEKLKASAISAFSPSYFKPNSVETLVECCRQISSAAPRTPFYFYDIPGMTNVRLSMPDFLEVGSKAIPTLVGLKFSNHDLLSYQQCLALDGGRFDVPFGVDEAILAALTLGGQGGVGSTYNFAAPIYHRLIQAFRAGDLETARKAQRASVDLIQVLSEFGYLSASKALMGLIGHPCGGVRLPLAPLSNDSLEALEARLALIGYFEAIGEGSTSSDAHSTKVSQGLTSV